jgi:hypothetical protein
MAEKKKPFKFPGEGPMPKKKPFKFQGEGPKPVYKTADAARAAATERAHQLRGESEADRKFRRLMEKYKYDITQIPGYKP